MRASGSEPGGLIGALLRRRVLTDWGRMSRRSTLLWGRCGISQTSGEGSLRLAVQAQPFFLLDEMRRGVEAAHVAHLGVALRTRVVVGRLGCAPYVERRLAQRTAHFGFRL